MSFSTSTSTRSSRRSSFSGSESDLEEQQAIVELERRRRHEQWVQAMQAESRFTHQQNRVRARVLIAEAFRLEKQHLHHQLAYCRKLVKAQAADESSPPRIRCESQKICDCPCLRAPVFRQLTAKYRAMNLLLPHFDDVNLENTVDTIQRTYRNDNEMMEDLLYRYGPEPGIVDPKLWLRSIETRLSTLKTKWMSIKDCVDDEMKVRDNFANVIRNFSVMRIFLEGAQAPTYSCDSSDRARRDSVHRAVLEELEATGKLFLHEDQHKQHYYDEEEPKPEPVTAEEKKIAAEHERQMLQERECVLRSRQINSGPSTLSSGSGGNGSTSGNATPVRRSIAADDKENGRPLGTPETVTVKKPSHVPRTPSKQGKVPPVLFCSTPKLFNKNK